MSPNNVLPTISNFLLIGEADLAGVVNLGPDGGVLVGCELGSQTEAGGIATSCP